MKWHKIEAERGIVLPVPNKLVLIRLKPTVLPTSKGDFTDHGTPIVLGEYEVGKGWIIPGFCFAKPTYWCDCLEFTTPLSFGLLPDYSIFGEN